MSAITDVAERYHRSWLSSHPFDATRIGVAEYDDRVPGESDADHDRRRGELDAVLLECEALESGATGDDAVTLACVRNAVAHELGELDLDPGAYTVTPMPYSGPAELLATAARTVLVDDGAAEAYLSRLSAAAGWVDQLSDRLRAGAARGRRPVAPLVEQTISWADGVLADPLPAALLSPSPPEGLADPGGFIARRDAIVSGSLRPALERWVAVLRELAPTARPEEQAGLCWLPGGEADYARCVTTHTTLPRTAEGLHETGMAEIARLEERARALGAEIGLGDLAAVHAALREASARTDPAEALVAARTAVRRAEEAASAAFAEPLPPPCVVTAMPHVVAASGAAPHYSAPRLDGSRPGTFWFNTELPTAGTGWDLEGVAFHEAVPGHHLQFSRLQLLKDLPAIQRQRRITVNGEGWGLYAEQLSEEMGLYSGTEALLGQLSAALMRACRLVVDTGIHALGWSRSRALAFYVEHCPMPESYLANEIDRYISWPGQALAYLTGKLEIVRLRNEAERALGSRFVLSEFHAAVLDHGSVPMPVLERVVRDWVAAD